MKEKYWNYYSYSVNDNLHVEYRQTVIFYHAINQHSILLRLQRIRGFACMRYINPRLID